VRKKHSHTDHKPKHQKAPALLILCFAFGCGDAEVEPEIDYSCNGAAAYANAGPYAAGVTTVEIDGNPTEIWYPADSSAIESKSRDVYDLRQWLISDITIAEVDAPIYVTNAYRDVAIAAEGTFPLVLFSHGLGSFRTQSTFLTTHLASWGYVVAAPDHAERGVALLTNMGFPDFDQASPTLGKVLDHLIDAQSDASSRFHQRLDVEKVMVTGHSAGGSTSVEFAHDPRVDVYAPLSVDTSTALPTKPSLFMAGSFDEVIPPSKTRALHDRVEDNQTNTYILIYGAGHNVFADICYIAEEHGGLLPLARKYDVPVPEFYNFLAEDGCRPSDLKPKLAWPMIQHYVTGLAQETLRPDEAQASFTPEAQACFGSLIETYAEKP
jgi:predicted dienelactone hydrolase